MIYCSENMPRKERIEYPGARYHIISRGNYRKDLFASRGSGEAFEQALFEVTNRCGWHLFAYVIMKNHYHLALETPEANLVAGMKWLQSSFATRFNRFHGERGHVFQGRYKSILLEDGRSMVGLINYIHLNPVRAQLCDIEHLKDYSLSSYARYWQREPPAELQREAFLTYASLPRGIAGMRRYEAFLKRSCEADSSLWEEQHKTYCRGWYLGDEEGRRALTQKLIEKNPHVQWAGSSLQELNEAKWEQMVKKELVRLRRGEKDITVSAKGSPWKVEIAKKLRAETTAPNPWIAKRLHMGHPNRVSMMVSNKC